MIYSTTKLDTTRTPEFLSLTPSTGLLNASNYGEDMIIGIVDSGVWPESPSFKDDNITSKAPTKWKGKCEGGQDFNSSMCYKKLIGVRYFKYGFEICTEKIESWFGVGKGRMWAWDRSFQRSCRELCTMSILLWLC